MFPLGHQDVDAGLLARANLEAMISSLKEEFYFYRIVYDEVYYPIFS